MACTTHVVAASGVGTNSQLSCEHAHFFLWSLFLMPFESLFLSLSAFDSLLLLFLSFFLDFLFLFFLCLLFFYSDFSIRLAISRIILAD